MREERVRGGRGRVVVFELWMGLGEEWVRDGSDG